ncbi:hypothetical protein BG000_004632 [Podila horticola]|nr:hypothetical protein BG000_004632 [Podila horticola]
MEDLENLETAIRFVRMHAETFRGTLRHASILGASEHLHEDDEGYDEEQWFIRYPKSCPVAYQWRMMECLLSLIKPTKISNKSWLRQCRNLKGYTIVSLGPNSFKSNDRKDHQGLEKDAKLQLPFLEHVSILAYNEPFGSELDDIGTSCGKTIQYFNIRGHQGPQGDTDIPPVRVGDHWKTLILSKLFVQMDSERLIIGLDFIRHCPSLKIVTLSDNHRTYILN